MYDVQRSAAFFFDFADGSGPVLAHYHPYGGGIVANSAHASDTAYIEEGSVVYGNAQVLTRARILNHSTIRDDSMVSGESVVDGSTVSGSARILDKASLMCGAWVRGAANLVGTVLIYGQQTEICDNAAISGNVRIGGGATIGGSAKVSNDVVIKYPLHFDADMSRSPTIIVGMFPYDVIIYDAAISLRDGCTYALELFFGLQKHQINELSPIANMDIQYKRLVKIVKQSLSYRC